MSRATWYEGGLRFTCTQCGDCCTGAPGYVWVNRREVRALAEFLKVSVDDFGARYLRKVGGRYSLIEKSGGDCVFFDKGCTVYPVRPRQCRTYPFWSEVLKSRRSWEEEAEECPGIGKGKFYALSDIAVIRRGGGDATGSR